MIIVAGSVEFNTADYQALKADILSLEAATRQENGCLYYSFALAAIKFIVTLIAIEVIIAVLAIKRIVAVATVNGVAVGAATHAV